MAKKKDISPYCTESFMFNNELYLYPNKQWFTEREHEVVGVNLKTIMGDSRLKLSKYNYSTIQDVKEAFDNLVDVKDMKITGIVKVLEFKQAKSGNYFYWIGIVDDHSFIKIYCNEKTFSQFNTHIIKGRCSLFNVKVSNGFISMDKCILLDNIPFKPGYVFVIHLPYGIHTEAVREYIEDELDVTIRRGNTQVFLRTYGYELFIDPTEELMNIIENKFGIKCSLELHDEYLFKSENKLIKQLEEYGY